MKKQVNSILIDSLKPWFNTTGEFKDGWFISKPLLGTGYFKFLRRLKITWRVLTGQSFAVHFKQDEL